MYRIRFQDSAARELSRLDKAIGRRIVQRICWLAANLDEVAPDALSGDLVGFFKLRIGDYRVVYEILHAEQMIVIHMIGHRKDVYRRL
jgi:mRNA interferase RelE/StbE